MDMFTHTEHVESIALFEKNSRDKRLKHELHIQENGMVTVREQLPEQLTELSEETTVEHAAETQVGLASWLIGFVKY